MQYIYKIVIDNLALGSVVFQFYFEIIKRDVISLGRLFHNTALFHKLCLQLLVKGGGMDGLHSPGSIFQIICQGFITQTKARTIVIWSLVMYGVRCHNCFA